MAASPSVRLVCGGHNEASPVENDLVAEELRQFEVRRPIEAACRRIHTPGAATDGLEPLIGQDHHPVEVDRYLRVSDLESQGRTRGLIAHHLGPGVELERSLDSMCLSGASETEFGAGIDHIESNGPDSEVELSVTETCRCMERILPFASQDADGPVDYASGGMEADPSPYDD